ncbi:MAG: hypothetical protein JWR12_811 [Mucilaginibacter sp.]|nr:hypothetical protein [Mucilaginibacter sp.]
MTYQDTFWKIIKVNLTKRPNITLKKLVYRSKSSPDVVFKKHRLSGQVIKRHYYSKFGILTCIAIHFNTSLMPFNHRVICQRQAQSYSFISWLSGKKWLHNFVFYRLRNPCTVVIYGYNQMIISFKSSYRYPGFIPALLRCRSPCR